MTDFQAQLYQLEVLVSLYYASPHSSYLGEVVITSASALVRERLAEPY